MTSLSLDSAFLVALGLGAVHALEPGHGKTALFAFLARGQRGLLVPAVAAASAALSHSVVLLILALIAHFVSHAVVDLEKGPLAVSLNLLSSVAILLVGVTLFRRASAVPPTHAETQTTACACCSHRRSEATPVAIAGQREFSPRKTSETGLSEPWLGATLGIAGGLIPCPTAAAAFLAALGSDVSRAYVGVLAFSLGIFLAILLWGVLALRLSRTGALRRLVGRASPAVRYVPPLIVLVVGGVHLVGAISHIVGES